MREIPSPEVSEILRPLPPAETQAAADALFLRPSAARARLLRSEKEGVARVASAGLEAFEPGALQLLSGGVPLTSLRSMQKD